jgi:dTDP-4-dehydrorhamnose reductase
MIGIIGSNGFLGKSLCRISKNFNYEIIEITKNNYSQYKDKDFDILINAATSSKKFGAFQNPYLDFEKTVGLTADIAYSWNYKKLIQISSISADEYTNHHPYSINKKAAEIISSFKNSLIIRLGPLYGEGLNKGPLYNLLNSNQLFVDPNSEYNYISTDFVSEWIFKNLNILGLVEVGARDTISLAEIARVLNFKVNSSGRLEKIFSTKIESGMPSSKEVLVFAKNFRKSLS